VPPSTTQSPDIREVRLGALRGFLAPVADRSALLPAGETERVRRLPVSRRLTHTSGRWLAHHALASIGCSCPSIGVGPQGEPDWPAGIVGSIAHTADLAIATVAPTATHVGIGVDIEQQNRAEPDTHPLLFTDREREIHRDRDLTLLFSAKEAFYKLYRPLAGRFLDFLDVEIDLVDDRTGTLRLRPIGTYPLMDILPQAQAHFLQFDGHWIVAIALPAATGWAWR